MSSQFGSIFKHKFFKDLKKDKLENNKEKSYEKFLEFWNLDSKSDDESNCESKPSCSGSEHDCNINECDNVGPTGPTGPTGRQGNIGPQGMQGNTGLQGPPGNIWTSMNC